MYKNLTAWALLFLAFLPAAQAEKEFLKPDQAFVISGKATDEKTVRFNWQIAEGYYLYQSKFRFLSERTDVELGDPTPPAGLPLARSTGKRPLSATRVVLKRAMTSGRSRKKVMRRKPSGICQKARTVAVKLSNSSPRMVCRDCTATWVKPSSIICARAMATESSCRP